MSNRIRLAYVSMVLCILLFALSVEAQTDALLTLNIVNGAVEISTDDGSTYEDASSGMVLEPNQRIRWSEDTVGTLEGPDQLQIFFSGPELGAGELRFDATDDPDAATGLRLQQMTGQAVYVRENDRADLDAFLALDEEDQRLECTNRQTGYESFVADPQTVANETTAPLTDASVKIIDASGESYGLLSSGWLFMSVDDGGLFDHSGWTMDANFETNVANLRLRRDLTEPDYTIVDRYCHDVVFADTAAATKPSSLVMKPLALQQEPLTFVMPELGTTVDYTIDPETGAITITMSPDGQATFIVPEGGLPQNVTILVGGFQVELDTTQPGSITLVSSGDGQLTVTSTGGEAIVTTPQGVVVTVDSDTPTDPAQAIISDTGTGAVVVQPIIGAVTLETNGAATTVVLPDGSTINIPAGDNYGLEIIIEPNGAVQVIADPENPAPLTIEPPAPADGTTPPPPISVVPGAQTGPICPGGVQPSGVGGACPPV